MGNVVLFEVLSIVSGLQPELTEGLPLRVRAHNAICANETSESDTIKSLGIENGSGVADPLCKIWSILLVVNSRQRTLVTHTRSKIKCTNGRLSGQPQNSLSNTLEESLDSFFLGAL